MSTEVVPSSFKGITQYSPSQASLPTTTGQAQRECEMDPLFLALLREKELVTDDTVYGRTLEG